MFATLRERVNRVTRRGRSQATTAPNGNPGFQTAAVAVVTEQAPAPPWWNLLMAHCEWVAGPSPELLEMQIEELTGRDAPAQDINAKRQELAVARLNKKFRQVRLQDVMAHTKPVPGTGALPHLALYHIGNANTTRRACTVQTQPCAKRSTPQQAKFTSSPPLMARVANLTQAFTGQEKGPGLQVIWTAELLGRLPEPVARELGAMGLLDEAPAESGATTAVTSPGGKSGLPHGTTAVMVGPAPWGFHTVDPCVLLVLQDGDDLLAWLHEGLGHFDLV